MKCLLVVILQNTLFVGIGGDHQLFENSMQHKSGLLRDGKQNSDGFNAIFGNSLPGENGENHKDGIELLREALNGEPGVDYPIYSLPVPQTSFDCSDKVRRKKIMHWSVILYHII